jgi:deoxyhypusine synthase
VVITTGALVAHGLIENLGRAHYKCPVDRSDRTLYLQGYNRIYDTLEMEANLDYAEEIMRGVIEGLDKSQAWSSESLCREIGKYLAEHHNQPGLLRNAYLKGVPVFIPAFTDSELGLDLAGYNVRRALAQGKDLHAALMEPAVDFNPFLDLGSYAQKVLKAKRLGVFTIGGGVPRNWAQQAAPFLELLHARLGLELPEIRFQYGVRICPEPAHWGGLPGPFCSKASSNGWRRPENSRKFVEVGGTSTPGLEKLLMPGGAGLQPVQAKGGMRFAFPPYETATDW